MDIWYLPTISEYIKLLVKPVMYKLTPEEAKYVLEEFDPHVRKVFLTKGLINLCPPILQTVLLPEEKKCEIRDELNVNNGTISNSKGIKIYEHLSTSTSNENFSNKSIQSESSMSRTKNRASPVVKLRNSSKSLSRFLSGSKKINKIKTNSSSRFPSSTSNEIKLGIYNDNILICEKSNSSLSSPIHSPKIRRKFEKENLLSSDEASLVLIPKKKSVIKNEIKVPQILHDNYNILGNLPDQEDFRFYEVHEGGVKHIYKTIVIQSSEKIKAENEKKMRNHLNYDSLKLDNFKSVFSTQDMAEYCWDNIDEYYKKEAKKSLKQMKISRVINNI